MKLTLIPLLLCLLAIFFQDLKYRRIHVALPLLILIVSFFNSNQVSLAGLKNVTTNITFFFITLSFLVLYMSIKNKRFLNPFQNYFGLGDLLFYVAITPLFFLYQYVIFFILSMLFSIIIQLLAKKIIKENTVPLAGFSALLLFLVIINDIFFDLKKFTAL